MDNIIISKCSKNIEDVEQCDINLEDNLNSTPVDSAPSFCSLLKKQILIGSVCLFLSSSPLPGDIVANASISTEKFSQLWEDESSEDFEEINSIRNESLVPFFDEDEKAESEFIASYMNMVKPYYKKRHTKVIL